MFKIQKLKYFLFNVSVLSHEKEHNSFNNKKENMYVTKEEKSSLKECIVMSIEMCNNFYEKKSLNNGVNNKNEHFPKNINDIFTDMYVNEMFVSLCEHMVDLCGKFFNHIVGITIIYFRNYNLSVLNGIYGFKMLLLLTNYFQMMFN